MQDLFQVSLHIDYKKTIEFYNKNYENWASTVIP